MKKASQSLDPELVQEYIAKSLSGDPWLGEQNVDHLWDLAIEDAKFKPLARLIALAGLADPNWNIREMAVDTLGEIGMPRDAAAVARLCKDERYMVRTSVYSSLGTLSGKRYLKRIIRGMEDSDFLVRRYAAVAVADVLDTDCGPVLKPYYDTEEDDFAKVGMAYGMALSGSSDALAFLVQAKDDKHAWLSSPAVGSLKDLAKRGIVPA